MARVARKKVAFPAPLPSGRCLPLRMRPCRSAAAGRHHLQPAQRIVNWLKAPAMRRRSCIPRGVVKGCGPQSGQASPSVATESIVMRLHLSSRPGS